MDTNREAQTSLPSLIKCWRRSPRLTLPEYTETALAAAEAVLARAFDADD